MTIDKNILDHLSEESLSEKPLLLEIQEELADLINLVNNPGYGDKGAMSVRFEVAQNQDGSVSLGAHISSKKTPVRHRSTLLVAVEGSDIQVQEELPFDESDVIAITG